MTWKSPKYVATYTALNMLLMTSPLSLPIAFYKAGIILSSVCMLAVLFISYVSAMYVLEAIQRVKQECVVINHYQEDSSMVSTVRQSPYSSANQNHSHQQQIKKYAGDRKQSMLIGSSNQQQNSAQSLSSKLAAIKPKQIDHIELFGILFDSNRYRVIPAISIVAFLICQLVSVCIEFGNIMSEVFKEVQLLNLFQLWLGLLLLFGSIFSLNQLIALTKWLHISVFATRCLLIIVILTGTFLIIVKNIMEKEDYNAQYQSQKASNHSYQNLKYSEGVKLFNFENFSQIYSTVLISFVFQHSIVGIAQPIISEKDKQMFLKLTFLISGAILFSIPLSACLAFGQELSKHKYYNFDFQSIAETRWVFYFVSCYGFLNVSAFCVFFTVIKKNLLKMVYPKCDPTQRNRQSIGITVGILFTIFTMSYFLRRDFQIAMEFVGGIFGAFIIFVFPALQVHKARQTSEIYDQELSKKKFKYMPFCIIGFGLLLTCYHIYSLLHNQMIEPIKTENMR